MRQQSAIACGAVAGAAIALAWPSPARPQDPAPSPPGFELTDADTSPGKVFFDAGTPAVLSFEFSASAPVDVRIVLVRGGKVKRRWVQHALVPGERHDFSWTPGSEPGPDHGRLSFRVGPHGGVTRPAGSFRLRDHQFPIRGEHSYGDRFGVPRSGGRTHEGQDMWAACGRTLVAARGGTVQAKGYSGPLYGHYLTIDGTDTKRDYFYAHLASRASVADGHRVRTGERIGSVGKTGNAAGEGCQLHFELWPSGWRHGHPVDPLRDLRRWDGWS